MRFAIFGLASLAMLAACGETQGPGFGGLIPKPALGASQGSVAKKPILGQPKLETVEVARGAVTIGGPKGYCVDKRSSRLRGDVAFVLLASCASVTGIPDTKFPAAPGLLTASVDRDPGVFPKIGEFLDFFQTDAGRATLARDGRARSVEIVSIEANADSVMMRIKDTSPAVAEGLQPTYWRGLLIRNERLITVTVNGFEARPVPSEDGRTKLSAFLERIRAETSTIQPSGDLNAAEPPRLNLFRRFQT